MAEKWEDQNPEDLADEWSEHRARMRYDWDNLIEDLIEEGRQKGVFDNLPGKGKPLNLSTNLFDREQELANKLLKENKLKPAWILHRDHIREQIVELRTAIRRTWRRHKMAYEMATGESHRNALIISWDEACLAWDRRIRAINKQVDDFNLKRPNDQLELFKFRLEDELKRADARRYLKKPV